MKQLRAHSYSSIYRRIVIILLSTSFIFFSALAYILFSLNRSQSEQIIQSAGNRVGYIMNRALHKSMLINDNTELKEIIVDMARFPGLVAVNIYNSSGQLRHSSRSFTDITGAKIAKTILENINGTNSDSVLFTPWHSQTYWDNNERRILSVSTAIVNEEKCSNATCHVHSENENILGLLQVDMSLAELDHMRKTSEINFFVMALLFSGVIVGIMITVTRRTINRPLSSIIAVSRKVAQGDWKTRIPVEEFSDSDMINLGKSFNHMLSELSEANKKLKQWSWDLEETLRIRTEEIKRTQQELVHIERMASLGKLSSSVAHEINNPLAGILTYSRLVSKLLSRESCSEEDVKSIINYLDMIISETERCGNIVKGLMDFARKEPALQEVKHLNGILKDVVKLVGHSFSMAQIDLVHKFNAKEDLVQCNPNQIKQICMAMLVNAIEASDKDNQVVMSSENDKDMNNIIIEFRDYGSGIRKEDLDHIFEPFFSRKKDGAGSGLGLSVAYGIVQQHMGRIQVESTPGKGTLFSVYLPLAKK